MNNAYFFDAGNTDISVYQVDGYTAYDEARLCAVVIAPSRGIARAQFIKWCNFQGARFEFTTSGITSHVIGSTEKSIQVDDGGKLDNAELWNVVHERGWV